MSVDKNIDINNLSIMTNGFSGAEINLLCREAGMFALSEDINSEYVKYEHFLKAVKLIKPVITKEMIAYYKDFEEKSKL